MKPSTTLTPIFAPYSVLRPALPLTMGRTWG
ncbi:hypothetical protein M080_4872, partial [Bacteroides fragilis str. 3397 T10]